MGVYSLDGNELPTVFGISGSELEQAYDINGNELIEKFVPTGYVIYDAARAGENVFAGGYIEIQPDSWDGSTVCTGDIVEPGTPTAWGFPMSLSAASKASIKSELFSGSGKGVSFIRFPMGFAYRGYRNIDSATGLAKNIGQRWDGQNAALNAWFSNISAVGGGLSVEYWCPAPYWLTGGAYYNASVNNELCAGGTYPRTTTLSSIKSSDPTQYASQIDAFTDAIVNDLEYVHQNVAPVRMYTLAAEPTGSGQLRYGHCHWPSAVYNDVFTVLHPKVKASAILSTYDGKPNDVLMHLCADDTGFTIGSTMINNHADWIWGYSHDVMRPVSGEGGDGADQVKTLTWPSGSNSAWKNVFICEYEYFGTGKTNEFRCSNNIVRMILEMVYRKAKIVMPIIHVCKPTGQSAAATNTAGYCLYAVDMETGNYTVNPWSYNSWKMFNDNLPVGAVQYMGGDGGQSYCGYAIYKHNGKTIFLFGNYGDTAITFNMSFASAQTMSGKLYNISNVGTELHNVSGSNVPIQIPAYSGCVYVAEADVSITNVSASRTS